MFQCLETELARRHRRFVQLHPRRTIAFDPVLDPHEYFCIYRLRAGVATEQPPGNGSEQEQGVGRDNQEQRKVENVLRPKNQAKQIELALNQMKKNRLPVVPDDPRQAVKKNLGKPDESPAPGVPPTLDVADIDLLVFLVERDGCRRHLRLLAVAGVLVRIHDDYIRIRIALRNRFRANNNNAILIQISVRLRTTKTKNGAVARPVC